MATQVAGYVGKINPGDGIEYSVGSTAYGVCDTAANVAAKIVDMTGFKLIKGATVFVQFTNSNTVPSPTLNVNSTGAKPIMLDGTNKGLGWEPGSLIGLTYDGTNWKQANTNNLMTKTYTGIIGTAANFANATFYFGKIIPVDYDKIWTIRYRITAECAGTQQAKAVADVCINSHAATVDSSYSWNAFRSTSYLPSYNHVLYRATAAGVTGGYGHLLGERMYSSWKATTAANSRTFTIEIQECTNCTFEFFDSMVKYANAPGTGETNYSGYTEINFRTQGLQETGDTDTNTFLYLQYYNNILAKTNIIANTIIVGDSLGYSSVTGGLTFDISYPILWCTTAVNAASINYADIYSQIYGCNINTMGTFNFAMNSMIYLVVTINGLTATIDNSIFANALPNTEDGKVYIAIGRLGDGSNGTDRVEFQCEHPMFEYRAGKLRNYTTSMCGVVSNNVSVTFVLDTSQGGSYTYEDFPYRATYLNTNITANMVPNVTYSLEQAMSQVFAPICESFNGGLYMYASEAGPVTIPSITAFVQ